MRLRREQGELTVVGQGVAAVGRIHPARADAHLRAGALADGDLREPLLAQLVDERIGIRRQVCGQQRLVVLGERLVSEAGIVVGHRRGEHPEDLGVRTALSPRRDRGLVEREVVVPPRPQHVEVLELRGRRKHDVRVARRLGHELLDRNREELVSCETSAHRSRVRDHHDGVAVVDEESRQRRMPVVEGAGERASEQHHVDLALGPVAPELGLAHLRVGMREGSRRVHERSPTSMAPRSGHRGQQDGRTHAGARVRVTLRAGTDLHERRSLRQKPSEPRDLVLTEPGRR